MIYIVEIVEENPETVVKYVIDIPTIVFSILRLTRYKKFVIASEKDLGTIGSYEKCFRDNYFIYVVDKPYQNDDIWGYNLIDINSSWNSKINNPHAQQRNEDIFSLLEFSRVLTISSIGLPYHRRKGELKTVLHWGQRKLLMSEIEFLTNECSPDVSYTVVYAGASPGFHITHLSNIFPSIIFELYDPAEFLIKETEKIKLHNEFFTDDTARQYSGQNVLFISDIRISEVSDHFADKKLVEDLVKQDMTSQKRWTKIMKPSGAMLKFRLPWEDGRTKYLKGKVSLPVWGPQTTTETRLICWGDYEDEIDYDNRLYESQMFYFNTVSRVACYSHLPEIKIDTVPGEGLDHCFDCTSEVRILNDYINKFGTGEFIKEELTNDIRCKCIALMSKSISLALGNRKLSDPQPPPPREKKYYDDE